MLVTNLKNRPNQFVINDIENRTITFQSYQSTICTVDDTNKTIHIYSDWDYSQTTLRYFKYFLENIGLDGLAGAANVKKALASGSYQDYTVIYN